MKIPRCVWKLHHCNYKQKPRALKIRGWQQFGLLHFVRFATAATLPQQGKGCLKRQFSALTREQKMLYRRRNLIFYTLDMQDNKWPIKTLLLEQNFTPTEALIPLQGA